MIAWVDLETTGLELECSIIEIACVVTDDQFRITEDYQSLVEPNPDANWNPYAANMHAKSGLLSELATSDNVRSLADVNNQIYDLLYNIQVKNEKFILGGSSVHFDHGFIEKYLPLVNSQLHYKHLDVSSLKILFASGFGINGEDLPPKKADTAHRAMDDINDSINAAIKYREYISRAWKFGIDLK